MIAWMLYTIVVGLCLAIAAFAGDALARAARRPVRFIWGAAAVLGVALPAIAPWRARTTVDVAGQRIDPSALLGMRAVQAPLRLVARHAPSAAWFLGALWAAGSVAVALSFVFVYWRLRRARRAWPVADLHGHAVRVSPDLGPLVIGLARPEIVVPRWVLDRSTDEQRMIVAHESAHVGARDPALLGAACGLAALMPWNPALWLVLSRVRLAIEVDCDARVLKAGVSPRSYGALLVDVAESAAPLRFAATALADDSSHLHQRILAMQPTRSRYPALRVASLTALAFAGLLAACEANMPTAADVQQMDAKSAERTATQLAVGGDSGIAAWFIDSRPATKAEANAVPKDSIASIGVVHGVNGTSRMYVTTLAGRARSASERKLVVFRRDGTAGDTTTVALSYYPSTRAPLYVIDGKRVAGDSVHLDPKRIQSVEVVKGAEAIRTWGDAGSNGVIVVTTKPAGAP